MVRVSVLTQPETKRAVTTDIKRQPWVVTTPRLRPGVAMRLFCLPYAGGGTAIFRGWQAALPSSIEVCPLRLPGREMRFREAPITSFQAMLLALDEALSPYIDEPYALFGHSMGASLAYELAARLAATGRPLPRHLIVAGRPAPHLLSTVRPQAVAEMSDTDLLQKMPAPNAQTLMSNSDLAELVLPALRADFALCQNYLPGRRRTLPVPLTALGGESDASVERTALEGWAEYTSREFTLRLFPGDHFFVLSSGVHVRRFVGEKLAAFG